MYGEFGGLLPPVKDLHQKLSAFLHGVAVCNTVDQWCGGLSASALDLLN